MDEQMAAHSIGAVEPHRLAPRVLAVIPGDGVGASMIFARRQVESLAAAGVQVRMFYLTSRTSPFDVLRGCRKLRREIREFRPDLIHAHYGTMTSFLCALFTDVPLVITFRGSDLTAAADVSHLRNGLAQLLSQISCLRAEKIICVSRRLRDRLWWSRSKAVVLPSGVDLQLFQPRSKQEARSLLGWAEQERIFLFNVGKQPRTKALNLVRAAVHMVQEKLGPVRLVVMRGNVSPEQMPVYLNAADCVVLASYSEGSPNIVKEALATNLPVVAVDVGDVAERLSGVYPSKIVARDPKQIAAGLMEILTLNQRSNGRETIQECSSTRVAAQIVSVYKEVLLSQRARAQAEAMQTMQHSEHS